MNKEQIKLQIFEKGYLTYGVEVKRGESFLFGPYIIYAEPLKNTEGFLLIRDTLEKSDRIFGGARKPEEADKRVYDAAKEIANYFEKKCKVKIEDNTPRGKNIQHKFNSDSKPLNLLSSKYKPKPSN